MHHAAVVLPKPLAAVLQHEPQLVAVAVEAFYYRDTQDLKAAQELRHFHPDQVTQRSRDSLRSTCNHIGYQFHPTAGQLWCWETPCKTLIKTNGMAESTMGWCEM